NWILPAATAGYGLGYSHFFYSSGVGEFAWVVSVCHGKIYRESLNRYDGASTEPVVQLESKGTSYHGGAQLRFASNFGVKILAAITKDKLTADGFFNEATQESPVVDEYSRTSAGLHSLITYDWRRE